MKNLRIYNLIMGFFHLIQAIAMFALTNDFSLPVNTNFLEFNISNKTLEPVIDKIYDVKIGYFVALFLLISSLAHFIIASPLYYTKYISNIKKGINYARWIEYSISSSVMVVIIAMLTGVYEIGALILIFSINAVRSYVG